MWCSSEAERGRGPAGAPPTPTHRPPAAPRTCISTSIPRACMPSIMALSSFSAAAPLPGSEHSAGSGASRLSMERPISPAAPLVAAAVA